MEPAMHGSSDLSIGDRINPFEEDTSTFTHPNQVINCSHLSTAAKRQLLASWASDARAVPNRPTQRQLESGAIVAVEDILATLRGLDSLSHILSEEKRRYMPSSFSRRRRPLRSCRHSGPRPDDDPPPTPAKSVFHAWRMVG
jgi:hypothetical protein